MAEAWALLPDSLSLSSYLANRRGYVHLIDLTWQPTHERSGFAVLRTNQILYATAVDDDVALVNALPATAPHGVELLVEGGLFLRGGLMLGPRQRLGDFLESAGPFVPLVGTLLLRSGRPPRSHNITWGDIVLNQNCIQAVWETASWLPSQEDPSEPEGSRRIRRDEPAPNEPA